MSELIDAAEYFSKVPLVALAMTAEAMHYEDPAFEMSEMISLQQRLRMQFLERDNGDPDEGEALYSLAHAAYANDDVMQTNVDPLEIPFDRSKTDTGTWVRAWVWVPVEELDAEIKRLRAEREKDEQAEFDLAEQDVALFGERGVDVVKGDTGG